MMRLLSRRAPFEVHACHFQQPLPALAYAHNGERRLELPCSRDSVGQKEHNQHIDRAVDETGALSQIASQSKVEQVQVKDHRARQRTVERTHTADQNDQQRGDCETQPGNIGTDDRLIDSRQCTGR